MASSLLADFTMKRKRYGRWLAVLLCISAGLALERWWKMYRDGGVTLTFFDVGQGDSALLEFPDGRALLIDGGGGFGEWDVGSRELLPELSRRGRLSLDAVLLSHPDQDHGYGLGGVFQHFSVGELWVNGTSAAERPGKPLMKRLIALAALSRTQLVPVRAASAVHWAGATVWRLPLDAPEASNDRALALILSFAGCRAFFGGDIETSAEAAAAGWLEAQGLLPVSLLKVGHHGSRTSSTDRFLSALKPRWGVLSVGVSNRYGHPHRLALERLGRYGVQLLRTDFHGYVRFHLSRRGVVRCETALGDCGEARCADTPTPPAVGVSARQSGP